VPDTPPVAAAAVAAAALESQPEPVPDVPPVAVAPPLPVVPPEPPPAPPPVVAESIPAVASAPAAPIVVTRPPEPPEIIIPPTQFEVVIAEVEEVSSPAAVPTTAAASEPAPDNLTVIDGIGPKVNKALAAAGITTYDRLMRASEFELREALLRSGVLPPKALGTWPRQARYAAEGDWRELYKFNAKRKLALND
jgi:predicted flap endonuclease-1-like 5' DNA nuclease